MLCTGCVSSCPAAVSPRFFMDLPTPCLLYTSFISVPLSIRTDAEEFYDDTNLDVDAMVSTLRDTKGRSYSACPNIADWESAFGESGNVIAFTITSALSGSYNAACVAKKNCEERNPARRIYVVDSLSAGPEIALLIERALYELRSHADFDKACEALNTYQAHTHLLFALESMHNLAQNGRVSKLAATMASVLGIRAIGQASAEGMLEMLGKCRGVRKARQFMLSEMVELGYKGGKVRIGHCPVSYTHLCQHKTGIIKLIATGRER